MSDMIDRQAAIKALGERPMVWVNSDYELGARNQYDADVLALETLPSAQPGWIPCKTRKPEKSGLYLVTKQQKTGEIQLATAHYNTAFDEWSGNGNFKKVLAWQPLPSPWKGSHDGD